MKRPSYKREPGSGEGSLPRLDARIQVERFWAAFQIGAGTPIFCRWNIATFCALKVGVLLPIAFLIAVSLAGCSNPMPRIGAISVTDPSGGTTGQVTSVIVSTSVNVTVAAVNGTTSLGVDWNLLCGGSAVPGFTTNVCGTITPVHVGSNANMVYVAPTYIPIGNTVTLTATATSDPSQSVSVTLTIVPKPVVIQFTQGFLPPSAMAASGTASVAANVTNDPVAAGVNWSVACASSSCGSFSIAATQSSGLTTFTAPAVIPSNGTVTITATSIYDNTKKVSSTIQIMPISVATTISQNPVAASSNATLTATVTWDAMNQGVTWAAPQCGSSACGSVSPGSCVVNGTGSQSTNVCSATYTAPLSLPAGTTTLAIAETATSVADPTKSGTVNFTIAPPPPISVSVTATPGAMQVFSTTVLAATVSYDFSDSGVTWTCSPACTLANSSAPTSTTNSTATYTAQFVPSEPIPANDASLPITVTATSIAAPASDPTGSGSTTVTLYQPISVTVTPPPSPITAGVPATFIATVTNDIASGGVDWTASGCLSATCGTFSSNHTSSGASVTYTPPTSVRWSSANPTVTITATSTASETIPPVVQSSPVQVAVNSPAFALFVPFVPSNLPIGNPNAPSPTLINLIAAVVGDSTNQGVDWTVSCASASAAACGQFLESPEMVQTATSADVPPAFWPYSTMVHAASGQAVVYEPPTQMPTGGTVTLTASPTANPTAGESQIVTISNSLTGPALSGKVQAGNLPVSGATVQLFAAGNTGYGSAATPLVISGGGSSVTTASDGSFAIPAGYVCPSLDTLLYLVALGGQPGGPQGPTNPQLGLMNAIGPCSNLNGSVPLIVNEVTTVASVFALSPFAGADYAHIGASSSNYNNGPNPSNATNYNNGLANAFVTVNNLVDITTGIALPVTPANSFVLGTNTPTTIVPQAEINTLADVIDTCAATAGGVPGDGSACSAFFLASNVNPPQGVVENAPTSILQALLEVAQVPGAPPSSGLETASGGPLFSLLPSSASSDPFTPVLGAAPYDWSIAISYSGGGMEGQGGASAHSSSMAIDASGNVWVANSNSWTVSELSAQGAALSPFATGKTKSKAGGFTGGGLRLPQQIAIDPYGNAWVLSISNTLTELAPSGAALSPSSGFSGAGNPADTGAGIAIDGTGNVWVADSGTPGDVAEYLGYVGESTSGGTGLPAGTPLSPAGAGYTNGLNNPNGAIAVAIEPTGTQNGQTQPQVVVWTLNQGNTSAVSLNDANGSFLDTDQGDQIDPVSGNPDNPPCSLFVGNCPVNDPTGFGVSMAIDNSGDIYIPSNATGGDAGAIYELLAGGSSSNEGGLGQVIGINSPIFTPISVDGAGNLWVANNPANATGNYQSAPISVSGITRSGKSINANALVPGITAPSLNGATSIAVDASGNVWVLGGSSPSRVTEFVGVAVPVVTPLSVGVQKNKLGTRP
ncbi:MAG: hypothetical protein ACLPY1_02155 [Terracidiphilus sp.]